MRKGFTPLLVLVIVAIVAAATLIVYQTFKNSPQSSPVAKLSSLINTSNLLQQKSGSVYTVVDTNQNYCFDDKSAITCGTSYKGQDAQYQGVQPKYKNNGDGTVSDLNTGLMWIKNAGGKIQYNQAAKTYSYAGYDDWRIPNIKELYSLMDFSGIDPNSTDTQTSGLRPFINTNYFDFSYGDLSKGDRIIDSQWITTNIYTSRVMNNQECFFGVNFADGRIKCYPTQNTRNNGYYLRYVRGQEYGTNDFVDNGDQTVTDRSTSLIWQKADSERGMDWASALGYCEDLTLAGHNDWRLPNAKELQYIVDYSRSPDSTNSPAIDPIFQTSSITNEAGQKDYPFFWTGTTHINRMGIQSFAVYVSFGRAMGKMNGVWIDVHGAGAQRSDPKSGNIADYPQSVGPQGDARRLNNYVRCVRGGTASASKGSDPSTFYVSGSQTIPQQPGQSGTSSQTPPPEAISACNTKGSGESCLFQTPKGVVSGTCKQTPDSSLACVPN